MTNGSAPRAPVASPLTYREAGVDLDAADSIGERIGALVESTRTDAVRGGFGSFGGRFSIPEGQDLVASADGVGTKLEVAIRAARHDTVGEDLVNHCVNDILAEGALPVGFMDYLACGKLEPDVVLQVVEGVARGCRWNGCALLGGETAEMPGFYAPGTYDLAGFIVGRLVFPEVACRAVAVGDLLVGLASSGLHTNGYSFARALLFDRMGLDVHHEWPEVGRPVGDVLLEVHRSYLSSLREACENGWIRALAHITGGGIPGNLRRVLPADLDARVELGTWKPAAEFRSLVQESGAEVHEIYRTLNMGIGMIAVVNPEHRDRVIGSAGAAECDAFVCGELVEGTGEVRLEG